MHINDKINIVNFIKIFISKHLYTINEHLTFDLIEFKCNDYTTIVIIIKL